MREFKTWNRAEKEALVLKAGASTFRAKRLGIMPDNNEYVGDPFSPGDVQVHWTGRDRAHERHESPEGKPVPRLGNDREVHEATIFFYCGVLKNV